MVRRKEPQEEPRRRRRKSEGEGPAFQEFILSTHDLIGVLEEGLLEHDCPYIFDPNLGRAMAFCRDCGVVLVDAVRDDDTTPRWRVRSRINH